MSAFVEAGGSFVREQLRAPLTLVLLVAIPAFFVVIFASVIGEVLKGPRWDAPEPLGDGDQRWLGGGVSVRDARLLPGRGERADHTAAAGHLRPGERVEGEHEDRQQRPLQLARDERADERADADVDRGER